MPGVWAFLSICMTYAITLGYLNKHLFMISLIQVLFCYQTSRLFNSVVHRKFYIDAFAFLASIILKIKQYFLINFILAYTNYFYSTSA